MWFSKMMTLFKKVLELGWYCFWKFLPGCCFWHFTAIFKLFGTISRYFVCNNEMDLVEFLWTRYSIFWIYQIIIIILFVYFKMLKMLARQEFPKTLVIQTSKLFFWSVIVDFVCLCVCRHGWCKRKNHKGFCRFE